MRKVLCATLFATSLLTACVVSPIAPPLPVVVELGADPYYYHSGYYYYYENDRWSYSHRKNGPRKALPRERYPREVRRRGHDGKYEQEREWERERDYRY